MLIGNVHTEHAQQSQSFYDIGLSSKLCMTGQHLKVIDNATIIMKQYVSPLRANRTQIYV